MKKILLITILLSVFVQISFGQSVKIVPKKVIYTRPDINAANDTFGMKTFTVTYPKISGANGKKIESLISYEKAFKFNLKEEFKVERGIQNLNFKILHNSKNILSIKLSLDAYTFSDLHYYKFLTVNTKTATLIEPIDVFKNLRGLAAECRKSQLKAIAAAKRNYLPEDYGTLFDDMNFTPEELNGFTVGNKGITFHYPYRFGRTSIMFEPNGDYFFSWKKLKPFIKPRGLLTRFVR